MSSKLNIYNYLASKKHVCYAPRTTLNFDSTGIISVCCYNRSVVLGKYPESSISSAWFNPKRIDLLKNLDNFNFLNGCSVCKTNIENNNYENSLIKKFDGHSEGVNFIFPTNFEFEFGNICNLECIMCGGKWSSSIRQNREKQKIIKHPYDDEFVKQLKFFIPYLKTVNFLGGEPFLTPLYYNILDCLNMFNKDIKIFITTNGTIFNKKIETYCNLFKNFKVIISLDSLNKETYTNIRKNSNFDNVLENLFKFKNLNVLDGISICPVIQNIYEIPKIFEFCIENNLKISVNIVNDALGGKIKGIHTNAVSNEIWNGLNYDYINVNNSELIPEFLLKSLPKKELKNILIFLNKFNFPNIYNEIYKDFINVITTYLS
jgi:MoaA/NifB/PqqE/SkfB family radical SAM enzyme